MNSGNVKVLRILARVLISYKSYIFWFDFRCSRSLARSAVVRYLTVLAHPTFSQNETRNQMHFSVIYISYIKFVYGPQAALLCRDPWRALLYRDPWRALLCRDPRAALLCRDPRAALLYRDPWVALLCRDLWTALLYRDPLPQRPHT